ncbi:MAG: isoleucine--tRNA ligase, partial [Chitinivibrionales bacterium]|nr:isoleucine--tRNA ligase [Chitinivibrionales bacterium]
FKVSGKRDIEKIGIDVFNEACRSIVLRYTAQWEAIVVRMGRWVDFVRQYRTMDPSFMESIWWVFKQVWDKDLIYRGFRVQPYCPRCATPLSNFEVNEGYRDVKGVAITVSFPLAADPKVKILVWTTTPWTLPSNVALAVGPRIRYVKIADKDDVFILAKERLGAYYKDPAAVTVLEEMDGAALQGLRYQPMFDYFTGRSNDFFKVTTADFVSTEDGTGVVHIAPAFGEDDFNVGRKLELPMVCPVDEEGKFTDEVPPYRGKLVFEADEPIIAQIKAQKRLVHRGGILHRYPHCYRCDTPLIYKAITTWFMKIEPLKATMLAVNQRIHWVPDHLQNGRFGKGIESAPDWNISRNRYWGTPIPVWICPACNHRECVGSLADFHRLAGNGDSASGKAAHAAAAAQVQNRVRSLSESYCREHGIDSAWIERLAKTTISPLDLHSHVVNNVSVACPQCKAIMKRTSEVLDCWFESGSMPYAQNHYPFENRQEFEAGFPADFIAEGLDQTRGWFYTLTVLGAALFSREAFKNVVVNGIILSEDGTKLSKRLKNYAPPEEILNRLGADALRLFLINSPAVKAEDLRFSEKGVREMSRAVLLPLWNAYSFFVTYALVDGWLPPADFSLECAPRSDNELDRWIVSLLNASVAEVNEQMEQYNLYRVVPLLVDFIDNLTNWYIRRSRRRFWKSENDIDKSDAYRTLYYVLATFVKVMAPFLPFLTDAIYRNLTAGKLSGAAESVHLEKYPAPDRAAINDDLDAAMALVRQTVGMGHALRSKFSLKNRQPLQRCTVIVKDPHRRELLAAMEGLIRDELNVKEVRFDHDENSVVTISAKANFKRLGKIFGSAMKAAAGQIEHLESAAIAALESGQTIPILEKAITYQDLDIRRSKRPGVEVETQGDITVALDTALTPELVGEGLAREFVNRIQTIRKNSDFKVTDRIRVDFFAPDELAAAIEHHNDYICNETLARSLNRRSAAREIAGGEPVEINDLLATIACRVVS